MKKTPRSSRARRAVQAEPGQPPAKKAGARAAKRPTNLTLDRDAVARGERYGAAHGTSLSQLVNRFLHSLPDEGSVEAPTELAPAVRRLFALAPGADREEYRRHLREKYGTGR